MYTKKSIGNFILLALEKATDGTVRINDFINNPKRYAYGAGLEYPLKKSTLSQALRRLRERGYVERTENKDEGEIIIKLTEVGEDFLLLSKSEDDIQWDGKWRIMVFDIPENKRLVRDVLRNRLKLWGFSPWQKSVWASKKNVTERLRKLVKELGIEDWVLIIESNNVGS